MEYSSLENPMLIITKLNLWEPSALWRNRLKVLCLTLWICQIGKIYCLTDYSDLFLMFLRNLLCPLIQASYCLIHRNIICQITILMFCIFASTHWSLQLFYQFIHLLFLVLHSLHLPLHLKSALNSVFVSISHLKTKLSFNSNSWTYPSVRAYSSLKIPELVASWITWTIVTHPHPSLSILD